MTRERIPRRLGAMDRDDAHRAGRRLRRQERASDRGDALRAAGQPHRAPRRRRSPAATCSARWRARRSATTCDMAACRSTTTTRSATSRISASGATPSTSSSQHRCQLPWRQEIVWGRATASRQRRPHRSRPSCSTARRATDDLFSGLRQGRDQTRRRTRSGSTLGSKLEHNDYSGFEVQPSARDDLDADPRHDALGAPSPAPCARRRAIDQDLELDVLADPRHGDYIRVLGSSRLQNRESVVAYETGYRVQPTSRSSSTSRRSTTLRRYPESRAGPPFRIEPREPDRRVLTLTRGQPPARVREGAEIAADSALDGATGMSHGNYIVPPPRPRAGARQHRHHSGRSEDSSPRHQITLRSDRDSCRAASSVDGVLRHVDGLADAQVDGYVSSTPGSPTRDPLRRDGARRPEPARPPSRVHAAAPRSSAASSPKCGRGGRPRRPARVTGALASMIGAGGTDRDRSAPAGAEPAAASEYEVKAAFLYNFAKFVEWPVEALPTRPLHVGILGDDPFGSRSTDADGQDHARQAGSRCGAFASRRTRSLSSATSDRGDLAAHPRRTLRGRRADRRRRARFADGGCDDRLQHQGQQACASPMNLASADVARLKMSSQLLKLAARLVGPTDVASVHRTPRPPDPPEAHPRPIC